jgi:hypothetical protein
MKPIALSCFVVGTVALCSVLVHPYGRVKSERSTATLLQGASVDYDTRMTLEKSCRNCHSEKTEWPWYSYVAPVSWMIEKDVYRARKVLNFSRWEEYDASRRAAFLGAISTVTQARTMPPWRYTLLHPEARISGSDAVRLSRWARAERDRLANGFALMRTFARIRIGVTTNLLIRHDSHWRSRPGSN